MKLKVNKNELLDLLGCVQLKIKSTPLKTERYEKLKEKIRKALQHANRAER